ncbi:MAG: hypothetical protein JXA14_20410 [Anaerolineae bacterium]|nr:hypothetical protein [Anaerolineae bacterium]
MQNTKHRITLKTVLILAACLALAAPVLAQVSAAFDLSWHVIGSGGGLMESDQYTLQSTIGQPAVGTMGGSGHDLCSGFWCGGGAVQYRIYLPLVVRNFSSTSGSIFNDDFNDGTLTGWTANYGTWSNPGTYMRGEYTLGNAWNMHSSAGSNIVYTGTVNLLSGNAVGLTFRSSVDGKSSYDVILDAVDKVFKISKRSPTTYQILVSHSMTVQRNHTYIVGVVANGNTIEAYLDGTKLLTTTDTTYSSGYLGVMVFQATATYDNLQAQRIP